MILMADDDEADIYMTKRAIQKADRDIEFRVVRDGEELVKYLKHEGEYSDPESAPRPSLILLDLNMPKLNGIEALKIIRSDPDLKGIPTLVFSTSSSPIDVAECYRHGANSFITKPQGFEEMVDAVKEVDEFWFKVARTPQVAN